MESNVPLWSSQKYIWIHQHARCTSMMYYWHGNNHRRTPVPSQHKIYFCDVLSCRLCNLAHHRSTSCNAEMVTHVNNHLSTSVPSGHKIIDSDVLFLTSLRCTLLFVLQLIGWKNFQLICSVPADRLNMQRGQKSFPQRFCEIAAIFTFKHTRDGPPIFRTQWTCIQVELNVFYILCKCVNVFQSNSEIVACLE